MGSDETLEGHKLNMAAVSTKRTDDIIASAVAAQFPACRARIPVSHGGELRAPDGPRVQSIQTHSGSAGRIPIDTAAWRIDDTRGEERRNSSEVKMIKGTTEEETDKKGGERHEETSSNTTGG